MPAIGREPHEPLEIREAITSTDHITTKVKTEKKFKGEIYKHTENPF